MGGEKPQELPADLSRAQQRFQKWRRTRKPKSWIPESLWELAVKMVVARVTPARVHDFVNSLIKTIDTAVCD